jgi:hypothetical protein
MFPDKGTLRQEIDLHHAPEDIYGFSSQPPDLLPAGGLSIFVHLFDRGASTVLGFSFLRLKRP